MSRPSSDSGRRGRWATSAMSFTASAPRSARTSLLIEVVSGPTLMPSSPPIVANWRATASAVSVVVPSRIRLPVRSASHTASFSSCRFAAPTTRRIVTLGTCPKGTSVTGMPLPSVKRRGAGMTKSFGAPAGGGCSFC